MPRLVKRDASLALLVDDIIRMFEIQRICVILIMKRRAGASTSFQRMPLICPYTILGRIPDQIHYLNRLVHVSDIDCLVNLRMDRNSFGRLCQLFKQLGTLKIRRFLGIEEQVAMFLAILAHHQKNKVVRFHFCRSGHTVSTYVHAVMRAVLNMHSLFLVKPDPVKEDCVDSRWKWFKVYFIIPESILKQSLITFCSAVCGINYFMRFYAGLPRCTRWHLHKRVSWQ